MEAVKGSSRPQSPWRLEDDRFMKDRQILVPALNTVVIPEDKLVLWTKTPLTIPL